MLTRNNLFSNVKQTTDLIMKNVLLILLSIFALSAFGQDKYNTIFFTENGEQFWVILNGVRQNLEPETNVKVTGLNAPMYKLKVIFKDKALGTVEKTLFMPDESAEVTFVVKRNRKGVYVPRYFGATPIKKEPTAPTQEVIVFMAANEYPADPWQTTTTTTTMMSTTTIEDNGDQGGSVGISEGGVNVGVGISIDGDLNQEVTETTVITSITTTTSGHVPTTPRPQDPRANPRPAPGDVIIVKDSRCRYSMGSIDFEGAKKSVASKTFADSKLTMAKQISDSNCLSARQVASIVSLFDFEDSKLDFAKYAYKRTVDKNNYFRVNDEFIYESSIDELNEFIK